MSVVALELTGLPPSTNRIWRKGRSGTGIHRSPEYVQWLGSAGWEIRAQKPRAVVGEFHLSALFDRNRSNADLDNRTKALLDLLQHTGVIADDKLCKSIRLAWSDRKPGHGGKTFLTIEEAVGG